MVTVGLRELRQDASELVRRVEAGESVGITVSGRLAAQLVPVGRRQWRAWDDLAGVFAGQDDPDWQRDMAVLDASLRDPWEPG